MHRWLRSNLLLFGRGWIVKDEVASRWLTRRTQIWWLRHLALSQTWHFPRFLLVWVASIGCMSKPALMFYFANLLPESELLSMSYFFMRKCSSALRKHPSCGCRGLQACGSVIFISTINNSDWSLISFKGDLWGFRFKISPIQLNLYANYF